MSQLKRLGMFKEIFPAVPGAPSMRPLLAEAPQPDEDLILNHLRNGRPTSASGRVLTDAFDTSRHIGSIAMMDDGVWRWPSVLTYYVERYHCRVPIEFVEHVRRARSNATR